MKNRILLSVTSTKLLLLVLLLIASQQVAIANNAFALDGEIKLQFDDNLSLSPSSNDSVEDTTLRTAVTGKYLAWSQNLSSLTVGAGIHYDYVEDTEDLSNYGIKLSTEMRHQFGTALTSPWVSLELDWTYLKFDDSDLRDGYISTATISVGQQINPTIGLSGGYRYFYRESTDDSPNQIAPFTNTNPDKAFDQERHNVFGRADFTINKDTNLYLDFTFFEGDVSASGRAFSNPMDFDRARDFAFGNGYVVWNLEADGYLAKLGILFKLTNRFSIDTSVGYLDVEGESNNDYDNTSFQIAGSYSFF